MLPLEWLTGKVICLVKVEDGGSIFDLSDDDFTSLLQPEVEVAAPEREVKVVWHVRKLFLDR